MNKKLLTLALTGALIATSIPAITASAAEIKQVSNINTISRSEYRTVKPGTNAYTSTSSPSSYAGYFAAGARVKVYWVRGQWARVFGTLDSGDEGIYYIPACQLY